MSDLYKDQCKDSGERQIFETGAVRDIQKGKGRFDLISTVGERRLARRYEQGAEKYGDKNYKLGIPISRCLDSAKRHLNQYLAGDNSEDHLSAIAWNVFTAMEMEENNPGMQDVDTRPEYKKSDKDEHIAGQLAWNNRKQEVICSNCQRQVLMNECMIIKNEKGIGVILCQDCQTKPEEDAT